jgi:hypothetical protein
MSKVKLYSLPKLCNCKGDLSKEWFVYYHYRNPTSGEMKRFKVMHGINVFATAAEREARAADIIQQLDARISTGWTPFQEIAVRQAFADVDVNSLHALLWQAYEQRKASWKRRTQTTMKNALNGLCGWLDSTRRRNIPVTRFTVFDAEDYMLYMKQTLGLSGTTINKRRGSLGMMFNYICKQMKRAGAIYDNPFLATRKVTQNPEGQYPFTADHVEQIRKVLIDTDPQLWLACMFVQYCMIRTTEELPFLKIGDMDIEKMRLKVRSEIAKNNKTQTIDIHPNIIAFMQRMNWLQQPMGHYIFGNKKEPGPTCYGKNNLSIRFSRVRDTMGFSHHYSLYSFKHTGNAELFEKHKPLPAIRDQNRHCDIRITDIYAKQYRFYNDKNIWD